mgnify:CR=1 FL=1
MRKKLILHRDTIRVLAGHETVLAVGGQENTGSRALCGTATTDGATGCQSEASGCPSLCEWSCLNQSCHLVGTQ